MSKQYDEDGDDQGDGHDEDAQIDKIADAFARRTTERGGRKKVFNGNPHKFNVRPKNVASDNEEDF